MPLVKRRAPSAMSRNAVAPGLSAPAMKPIVRVKLSKQTEV